MITGPIMAFHWGNESVLQWAIFLHYVATMSVLSGMFVHIYMAALFPEERPAFFSMIGGKVNELYAYLHHYKWWAELKRKEHAWFKEELEKDGQDLGPLKDCGKYEGHTD
jgi:cytochrome b subunit of formate dehydrogenase